MTSINNVNAINRMNIGTFRLWFIMRQLAVKAHRDHPNIFTEGKNMIEKLNAKLDQYPNATGINESYAKFFNTPFDENGNTLLHLAVVEKDLFAIHYLLNHNSDFNQKNKNNMSPYDLLNNIHELKIYA